jgi:ABC-type uncharacterized transport system permease subunit
MQEEKETAHMIFDILAFSAPLFLASFGALASEYAGRMALFIDGMISLSSFLCFAFTVLTGSAAAGCILSASCCILFIFACSRAVESFNADPFLASLALNIFCGALVSFLSASVFGTRGVLTSPRFVFNASSVRLWSSAAAYILTAAGIAVIQLTRPGLYLRITGSDSDVLSSRGVNTSWYRTASWCTAAAYASAAGCILSMRLSSFVPNISSGRGWLALAAVFLGRRSSAGTAAAVLVMCGAEYAAVNLQNVFSNIASPLLISLPYIIALLFILIEPARENK